LKGTEGIIILAVLFTVAAFYVGVMMAWLD